MKSNGDNLSGLRRRFGVMGIHSRRMMSAAAICTVLVVASGTPAAAAPVFTPGAPGIGDSYFPGYGNGGYDVAHYQLDVRYDPATDELTGRAQIAAKATQNLSSFNLDLVGLTVDSLKVNGVPARWSRAGQELTVTPSRGLRKHVPFTVDVRYHGVPVTFVLPGTTAVTGFIHTDDGAIVAGQPEVAAAWYPVNDHPRDPASYTFSVTVPQGLSALCNGVLLGTSQRDGWTTWRWSQKKPMISYLATATIGVFDIKQTTHNGRPTYIAIDPDLPPGFADDAVGRTDEITDFLAQRFGPYPFEANGAIVDDYSELFFALENQTKSIYSKLFFAEGVNDWETFVVAHELAHQWYGDSVAVNQWSDIWLNEGFASYAEWLWSEHLNLGTPQEIFDELYSQDPSESFWSPPPGDPGVDFLFDDSVYVRGAMTVHALRLTVGDDAFWSILRRWASEHKYSTGSTSQLIALAERVSGQQLDALFDAWLFTEGKPPYPGAAPPARSQAAATVPYLDYARNHHHYH